MPHIADYSETRGFRPRHRPKISPETRAEWALESLAKSVLCLPRPDFNPLNRFLYDTDSFLRSSAQSPSSLQEGVKDAVVLLESYAQSKTPAGTRFSGVVPTLIKQIDRHYRCLKERKATLPQTSDLPEQAQTLLTALESSGFFQLVTYVH